MPRSDEIPPRVLGWKLVLDRGKGDTGGGPQMPAELQDRMMHATLKSGNLVLLGSDICYAKKDSSKETRSFSLWNAPVKTEFMAHIPNLQVVEIPRIRSLHHFGGGL